MFSRSPQKPQSGTNYSEDKKLWALVEKDNPQSLIHIRSAIPGSVHYHPETGEPLSPRVRHPKCPTFAYWPNGDLPKEQKEEGVEGRRGEGMLHRFIKEAVAERKAVTFQLGPRSNRRVDVVFDKVILERVLKPPNDRWRVDIVAKIAQPASLTEVMNEWLVIEVVVAHPPSAEKLAMLRSLGRGVAVISAYGAMQAAANKDEAAAGGFERLSLDQRERWRRRAQGFLKTAYLKPIIHIPGLGDPRWNRDAFDAVVTRDLRATTPLPQLDGWADGMSEGQK